MTTAVPTRRDAAAHRRWVSQVIDSALLRNGGLLSAGSIVRSVLICAAEPRADHVRDSSTALRRSEARLARAA